MKYVTLIALLVGTNSLASLKASLIYNNSRLTITSFSVAFDGHIAKLEKTNP